MPIYAGIEPHLYFLFFGGKPHDHVTPGHIYTVPWPLLFMGQREQHFYTFIICLGLFPIDMSHILCADEGIPHTVCTFDQHVFIPDNIFLSGLGLKEHQIIDIVSFKLLVTTKMKVSEIWQS